MPAVALAFAVGIFFAVAATGNDHPSAEIIKTVSGQRITIPAGTNTVTTTIKGKKVTITRTRRRNVYRVITHNADGSTVVDVVTGPGSTVTKPGSTVTKPGSTVTGPGSTVTQPASTVTQPASTITLPATTITLPGSTGTITITITTGTTDTTTVTITTGTT